ncbi:MAG: P-type conjugative transfer protein VirB9 [Methylotenera sp.]
MRYLLLVIMLLPMLGIAEITPNKSPYDSRVRVIDYNKLDVVKLSTFYGVSTHVQFADDETIKDVAVGDDQAWNIVPRGNHLFIKPKARKADTNVTVVTDKRVYNFALVVAPRSTKDSTAWKDPNLVYGVAFRYPEEEAVKLAAEKAAKAKADETKRRFDSIKNKFSKTTKDGAVDYVGQKDIPLEQQNYDYWSAGSPEISPTAARDDGRFTYLAFSNNRDMPAVYSVDAEGKEALINTNVEGNTIIIHRVVPTLKLRKGGAVVCIRNNSFDLDGGADNSAGTIAPGVERVIKEKQ